MGRAALSARRRSKNKGSVEGGRREKSAQKKEAILDIAVRLFLEKGYSGTSTSDVCRTAGISKPSLYHFFKSKRHLFFSCHMRSINQQLKPFLEKASTITDPEKRLRFMVRDFTRTICRNPELKVLIHETMTINDQYFKKIRDVWKGHYLLLKTTIAALQQNGSISMDLKPSRAALFLLGMMTWITFWFDYGKIQEADDVAESALGFALKGLSYKKRSSAQKNVGSSKPSPDEII